MADLKEKVKDLPNKPGIYQYFDKDGKIIYIGKAKSLKKRVSSYFTKGRFDNGKTYALVRNIANVKYILVDTEYEAMLLENSLIKKYQPRYNIQWRDDKSFPFIRIRKERFPRVHGMRNPVHDGSTYYGPYANVKVMKNLVDMVTNLYTLRNCNYNLSEENIKGGKFKVCLEYHIGNCKAPCVGEQGEADYNETIGQIRKILKGDINSVIREVKDKIKEFSTGLEFEKAATLKARLDMLQKFQTKSTVVNPSIHNVDVFAIVSDEKFGYVNFMKVINGAIVQGHTLELKKKLDESDHDLLVTAIAELRQRFDSESKEMYVPFEMDIEIPDVKLHVPQRGDKKRLMELSLKNAKHMRMERQRNLDKINPNRRTDRILGTLQKDLRLSELPTHIECFDNSNFQGAEPVAACVVFKNAKPSKKDYRHFNIRTVTGPDDFASMEEVIQRRYKRLLEEDQDLPQLIIVDGGKGQLSSAMKSLDRLGLRGKIAIVGVAKKLEEIYFPEDPLPLYIDKRSESLKLIQHLRNEAHRFGITHHRKRRKKATIKSELTEIPGIGKGTVEKLLTHFKSVKRVKEATVEDLAEIVGKSKAEVLSTHFNN